MRCDKDLARRIDAARERKAAGLAEVDAANIELGECFAVVIRTDDDLKAAAGLAGVSRTTAYSLAERHGEDHLAVLSES